MDELDPNEDARLHDPPDHLDGKSGEGADEFDEEDVPEEDNLEELGADLPSFEDDDDDNESSDEQDISLLKDELENTVSPAGPAEPDATLSGVEEKPLGAASVLDGSSEDNSVKEKLVRQLHEYQAQRQSQAIQSNPGVTVPAASTSRPGTPTVRPATAAQAGAVLTPQVNLISRPKFDESRRKEFFTKLISMMHGRGTPLGRIPMVGPQELDLYKLYYLVSSIGGLHNASDHKFWFSVATELGLPLTNPDIAFGLRVVYQKYLYPFERKFLLGLEDDVRVTNAVANGAPVPIPGASQLDMDASSASKKARASPPPAAAKQATAQAQAPNIAAKAQASAGNSPNRPSATGSSRSNMKAENAPSAQPSAAHPGGPRVYRVVDTYGGFDVNSILALRKGRSRKTRFELGPITFEGIGSALRSGLALQIAWGLNVLTVLANDSGFNFRLSEYPRLLEDLLRLLKSALANRERTASHTGTPTLSSHSQHHSHQHHSHKQHSSHHSHGQSHAEYEGVSAEARERLFHVSERDSGEFRVDSDEELTYCVGNILRGLSFLQDNQGFLASSPPFLELITVCLGASQALETRCWAIVIVSNIATFLSLSSAPTSRFIEAMCDLIQPRQEFVSFFALESLAKLTLSWNNQEAIARLQPVALRDHLSALLVNALFDGDDEMLELALMAIYNVSTPEGLCGPYIMASSGTAALKLLLNLVRRDRLLATPQAELVFRAGKTLQRLALSAVDLGPFLAIENDLLELSISCAPDLAAMFSKILQAMSS